MIEEITTEVPRPPFASFNDLMRAFPVEDTRLGKEQIELLCHFIKAMCPAIPPSRDQMTYAQLVELYYWMYLVNRFAVYFEQRHRSYKLNNILEACGYHLVANYCNVHDIRIPSIYRVKPIGSRNPEDEETLS